MKILLRLLIKPIATPIFLVYIVPMIIISYGMRLWEWLYDASTFEKSITRSVTQDFLNSFKKWFTTI